MDERTRSFMEFFESQGFTFVDAETREPILKKGEKDAGKKSRTE